MIKKYIIILTLLFVISISQNVKALSFEELPTKQASKQWSVQVDEAEKGENLTKPVKGKFHTYSLKIDKLNKSNINSVVVNLYRKEPNSNTKYSLFSCPEDMDCEKEQKQQSKQLAKQLSDGMAYEFSNFLIAETATELEVEIVWTEDSKGRPLKETFIFSSENKK
jgi:hypothetical protein